MPLEGLLWGMHAIEKQAPSRVTFGRFAAGLGLSIGLALVGGFAAWFFVPLVAPSWGEASKLGAIVAAVVYASIVVGHVLAFGDPRRAFDRLGMRGTSAGEVGLALALWVGAWALAGGAYVLLGLVGVSLASVGGAFAWVGADGGRLASAGVGLLAVSLGRIVVLVPLAEEMLFRGSLFGWLRGHLGAWGTIGATALVFTVVHPLVYVWPAVFLIGVAFGWVRERTGSITPLVIVHAVNGVALVVASYVLTGWQATL